MGIDRMGIGYKSTAKVLVSTSDKHGRHCDRLSKKPLCGLEGLHRAGCRQDNPESSTSAAPPENVLTSEHLPIGRFISDASGFSLNDGAYMRKKSQLGGNGPDNGVRSRGSGGT